MTFKNKWLRVVLGLMFVALYAYGYSKMYFHQDDLDWFVVAKGSVIDVVRWPIGDHVNYVWRALLKIEWELYGWYFPAYLGVSLIIHALVVRILYLLSKATTEREDLATMVALIFCINTNWTETLLWMSGQTITITALLVLLTMYKIWQKKVTMIHLILTSWTSALAIGMYLASMIVYPKTRIKMTITLIILGLSYYFLSTDGTAIEYSWRWGVQVMAVAGLALVYSVVGRLIVPFDRMENVMIVLVILLIGWGVLKYHSYLAAIWSDKWSRFLGWQLVLYYLIVAVGRAQYGIGIMRAERYAYLGLALLLLLVARIMRNVRISRWHMVGVGAIVMIQSVGLFYRAEEYIVRPQQLKQLVTDLKRDGVGERGQEYLPHFVFNDERWRYSDLQKLLK